MSLCLRNWNTLGILNVLVAQKEPLIGNMVPGRKGRSQTQDMQMPWPWQWWGRRTGKGLRIFAAMLWWQISAQHLIHHVDVLYHHIYLVVTHPHCQLSWCSILPDASCGHTSTQIIIMMFCYHMYLVATNSPYQLSCWCSILPHVSCGHTSTLSIIMLMFYVTTCILWPHIHPINVVIFLTLKGNSMILFIYPICKNHYETYYIWKPQSNSRIYFSNTGIITLYYTITFSHDFELLAGFIQVFNT